MYSNVPIVSSLRKKKKGWFSFTHLIGLRVYGHVSCSSGLAKTILKGTVKGRRRQGRQRKTWEDNIREWTGLGFTKSPRAVENREKMEETG